MFNYARTQIGMHIRAFGNKTPRRTSEFFAKHFVDRDRAIDETFVKEEIRKQADNLRRVNRSSTDDSTESVKKLHRRRQSHWRNYRPLSPGEIERINSFDRLSRIMSNEVHQVNIERAEGVKRSSDRFVFLEKKLSNLLETNNEDKLDAKSMVALVKCLYHLSIVDNLEDLSLVNTLLTRLDVRQLKPRNVVYLLEALSRLRFRDHRLLEYLNAISLCWPKLQNDPMLIVKAANAIARLDVAKSSPYMAGLVSSFAEVLPRLTRSQLERIKAVCVIELFDEVMVLDYLVLSHQQTITYYRHLVLVYLQFRQNELIMSKLPVNVKEWIEDIVKRDSEIRMQSEVSSSDTHAKFCKDIRSYLNGRNEVAGLAKCGPFTIDILLNQRVVIEACSKFQFYTRTTKFTSEARLRHSLLRSLGFELVLVPHFEWDKLSNLDKAKYFSKY